MFRKNSNHKPGKPLLGQADIERTIGEYRKDFFRDLRRHPLRQIVRFARRWLQEMRSRRGQQYPENDLTVRVPPMLRPPSYYYRGFKGPWLEEYFCRKWHENPGTTGAAYLPIFFDGFFIHAQCHSYLPGEFRTRYLAMWRILDSLRSSPRAYFCVQGMYEFPIWEWHLFPRNIIVAAAAGCGDIAIPLLKGDRKFLPRSKDIRVSFMGAMGAHNNALNVRAEMQTVFADIAHFGEGDDWADVMARSCFSLCPRGQGPTSFRLFEALSVQSIPIYIWKQRCWLPYSDELDWSAFAFVVEIGQMAVAKQTLLNLSSEKIAQMQKRIAEIYRQYFSYDGACAVLRRKMESIPDRQAAEAITAARDQF